MITENHGTALCEGTDITYIRNDMGLGYCGGQPDPDPTSLTFCGYFKCTGQVTAKCTGMVPDCHGPGAGLKLYQD